VTKIYELHVDNSLYNEDDYDGRYRGIIDDTPDSLTELCELEEQMSWKKMPPVLEFNTTDPARLEAVNVAKVNSFVDVFSEQLIDVFTSVGNTDWTLVPTRFFDKYTKKEVCHGKFTAVFFEYHSDFFNYELSEYTSREHFRNATERMQKQVNAISKMILNEPNGGFPPFFRLLANPLRALVSEDAHNAILEAELKGLSMYLNSEF